MIKTKVIPRSQTVTFEVPVSFIGKEIEIIAYSQADISSKEDLKPNGEKLLKYVGMISESRADEMQTYLKEARAEWDRDIF